MTGFVSLVGAGPGDAGLLTARAIRRLEQADAVVYDRLISPRALTYANPAARCFYAGKSVGRHALTQSEINHLLSKLANSGKRVVRLKGGDPFVFGRGSEEAAQLVHDGIPFEVVPGVTSAVSAPTYAGIPITHRSLATGFSVVTGHVADDTHVPEADWHMLGDANRTLVFLMGVGHLHDIIVRLLLVGRSAATPAAVIQSGARAAQRVIIGTLATIEDQVKAAGIQPPAVIVVGDVVKVAEFTSWVEKQPLFGIRLVVTADNRETARDVADMYEDAGAEVVDFCGEDSINRADQAGNSVMEAVWGLADVQFDAAIYTSPEALSKLHTSIEQIKPFLRPNHLFASGTHAAEITQLAAFLAEQKRRRLVYAT